MSYILQVFAGNQVVTVAQAAAVIHGHEPPPLPTPGQFARFGSELERAWPGVASDPAWPEGLDPPDDGEAVWALAVDLSRVGENLWSHVGHAAARAGLHVLDPQAGVLLRPDGMIVNLAGSLRELPLPMPWLAAPPVAAGLSEDEAQRWLIDAATRRFGAQGFTSIQDDHWLQFVRRAGDVQQCIKFVVAGDRKVGTCSLNLGMSFHCPRIRHIWASRFHDQVAAHLAVVVRRSPPEFSVAADQIEDTPGPLSEALGGRKFPQVATQAELAAWFDRVTHWFDETGMSMFDRATSAAGLAPYVLHPQQERWLYLNNNLFIEELFGRLVIAATFQPDRLDTWVSAFRDHCRRKGPYPLFGKDLFVPNRTAVFNDLVDYVRTDAFRHESLRLKG